MLLRVLTTLFILNSLSKPSYRIVKKAKFVSGWYLSLCPFIEFLHGCMMLWKVECDLAFTVTFDLPISFSPEPNKGVLKSEEQDKYQPQAWIFASTIITPQLVVGTKWCSRYKHDPVALGLVLGPWKSSKVTTVVGERLYHSPLLGPKSSIQSILFPV